MIENMTIAEATERLRKEGVRITTDVLRKGIIQNTFPFGSVIQKEKPVFYVWTKLLEDWISERSTDEQ